MALLRVVILGLGVVVVYLALSAGPCRCVKCGYHVNEHRMSDVRRREAVHDIQHRGFKAPGFAAPPDRFPCPDPECPRNPR